jgi:hypothetical protein
VAHRPREPLRRHVGDPERDAELAEHAQMFFAPSAQADQQDVHAPRSVADEVTAHVLDDFIPEEAGAHPADHQEAGEGTTAIQDPYFDRPN